MTSEEMHETAAFRAAALKMAAKCQEAADEYNQRLAKDPDSPNARFSQMNATFAQNVADECRKRAEELEG